MKIVVVGGSGLIGRQLVPILREAGHEALAASPSRGVNTLDGTGLAEALQGAQVVADVSNSPSFADDEVLAFFETSTRNLTAAALAAGVTHYLALSVVGADRIPDSGYMRAKVAQESLIRASGLPYTILRATQFFEFLGAIAGAALQWEAGRVPAALMQPVASADVAARLAELAVGVPIQGIVDLAGPDKAPMESILGQYLTAQGDSRRITADPEARYFGAALAVDALVPLGKAYAGPTLFAHWLGLATRP